jgi:hypothetical protein
MDGLDGLSALATVQARIADITARVAAFDPATGTASGVLGGAPATTDPSANDGSGSDFASALATATSTSTAPSSTTASSSATPDAIPANGDMRSAAARLQFAHDLLTRLGLPQTPDNLRALVAWQNAEGTAAAFNPLATTRSSGQPGESQFNAVGVKNFASYDAGLQTTIAALQNGLYGPILAALQQGDNAQAVAQAVANSRWGTGQAILRALPNTTV